MTASWEDYYPRFTARGPTASPLATLLGRGHHASLLKCLSLCICPLSLYYYYPQLS